MKSLGQFLSDNFAREYTTRNYRENTFLGQSFEPTSIDAWDSLPLKERLFWDRLASRLLEDGFGEMQTPGWHAYLLFMNGDGQRTSKDWNSFSEETKEAWERVGAHLEDL